MYNYPGRGQPPRTTVFPTTFRRGRLAYLDPATLPPAPEDAAITGQDDQSMDSRTCSANLLARLGPSIYQPADQPATSTSPIVLTTSPRPLLRGGSMADSGEQAPAHRHRTIYPAHPGDGVLPTLLAAHANPNARVSHPTDELQTNSLALARTEGPTRGVIVTPSFPLSAGSIRGGMLISKMGRKC